MTRSDTISEILRLTNKAGNVLFFEKLDEKTDTYLSKLLTVIKKLKK